MTTKKQPRPISEIKFEMIMMERMLNEYEAIAPRHKVKEFKEMLQSERHMFKNLSQTRLLRAVLKRRLLESLASEKAYWEERLERCA